MNLSNLPGQINSLILLLFISGSIYASDTWKFKVYLGEQEIGEHVFEVVEHKNEKHVRINAEFDVYFLFINAYEYRHENYEVWKNQCLQSVKSRTNDNGEEHYVQAEFTGKHFIIQTSNGQYSAEGCIQSFAYWDPEFLKSQQLLNAQTGEITTVSIEKIGEEVIMARNRLTPATHYRLATSDFVIDLWYSEKNEWLALNSTTSNGSTLRYQIQ